ncbi:MAG: HAD-IA family hydrolase, partial [Bacteroidetes bacterium]|nr:HAD-IA family hydrolase [Bacteroidota bacterium]
SNLFPHTHETLTYLQQKYKLHLISNGFKESTEYKVKNTNLTPYFQNVIISEVLGINKPDKAIFQYAIDKAKASTQQSLMIGDSIEADVRGALNFGMDAIYFNPNFAEIPEDVSWHINHLEELTRIL